MPRFSKLSKMPVFRGGLLPAVGTIQKSCSNAFTFERSVPQISTRPSGVHCGLWASHKLGSHRMFSTVWRWSVVSDRQATDVGLGKRRVWLLNPNQNFVPAGENRGEWPWDLMSIFPTAVTRLEIATTSVAARPVCQPRSVGTEIHIEGIGARRGKHPRTVPCQLLAPDAQVTASAIRSIINLLFVGAQQWRQQNFTRNCYTSCGFQPGGTWLNQSAADNHNTRRQDTDH